MNRKKMIMYVLLSMLALSMGGLSASAAATAGKTAAVDKAIESIMKTKFVPVYYERKTIGKMKSVSQEKADPQKKTDPQTEETVVKTWDNTAKGQYREEAKSAGKTYYVVSDGKKTIHYTAGEKQAIAYPSPVNSSPIDAKHVIRDMQVTTDLTLVGEENMLSRTVYHFKGEGKTVKKKLAGGGTRTVTYPDMEIWVDKKTGLLLKQKRQDQYYDWETTVTKIDFPSKFPTNTFKLSLPKGVKVVDAED
ncbi:lipoprotein localization protein LolA/LolB/LppX [Paenibacillus sp. 32O-W]|jgi:outer membrane lipoprotein-sorting protein|uniref:LolA family protein n=1 Tax=Paenibacillus sp. 32O-W TaxID=1695218 RepID=UPI00071F9746|nr:hypothetical protein [Paenibacillus sp. 32O-W]ALS26463.1 lipoprotein localization protein LolA/LolB/LppX [Paenibacillus sp. 32O-W]